MALTDIANRKTPSTPLEITFGAQPVATGVKIATLIGHRASSGGSAANYAVHNMINVGDAASALAEVDALAGSGSQIGKMAKAFVNANQLVSGRANHPAFRIVILANADTDFGPADEATEAIKHLRSDLVVSPYDATSTSNLTKIKNFAVSISGPDSDLQGQFGTFGVVGSITDSTTLLALTAVDEFHVIIPYLRDTNVSPAQTVAVLAAGAAGVYLQNQFPYLPLRDSVIGGLLPPTNTTDRIPRDPAGLSESLLNAGYAPMWVDASGNVRIIRTVTTRITTNGIVPATDYIDYEQLVTLFDFREEVFLRLNQDDLKIRKASIETAALVKDEILRIAKAFDDAQAFEGVNAHAKEFLVERSSTDRARFDFKIPVDVIPGLSVVAGNIVATNFGSFSV